MKLLELQQVHSKRAELIMEAANVIAILYKNLGEYKCDIPNLAKRIIDPLWWDITELVWNGEEWKRDKYGIGLWTKEAYIHSKENVKSGKKGRKQFEGLIHEHVVPRKIFNQYLRGIAANDDSLEKKIAQVLVDYAYSVVVTTKQNKDLNSNFTDDLISNPHIDHVFQRYKQAKIDIFLKTDLDKNFAFAVPLLSFS